jgi:hypothetical protein
VPRAERNHGSSLQHMQCRPRMLVPMHGTGLAMPSRRRPRLWAYPRTDNMARLVSSAGVSCLVPAGAERRAAPLPAPGIAASVD